MSSGFKILLAALLLSVMALFFCPLAVGSFQSTHGPISTLDSGAVTLDLSVALFIFVLPIITLRLVQGLQFESLVVSPAVISPLRTLLCTFRC